MGAMALFWASAILARGFMVVWIGGVAAAVAYGVYGKTRPALARRMSRALIVVVVAYIASAMAVSALCARIAEREFLTSLTSRLPSIQFVVAGKPLVISDQQAIDAFRRAVLQGARVSAHHSSPTGKIRFTLQSPSEVYSVGKDSHVGQELWIVLEQSRYPTTEHEIMHISSPQLVAWLDGTVPRSAGDNGH